MRLLVLSDLHADPPALDRALRDAEGRGFDRVLFLGDAVGYGSDAVGVVRRLRGIDGLVGIRGNHEGMMAALERGERGLATPSIERRLLEHAAALDEEDHAFLAALPERASGPGWEAAHGSPRDPDEYLISVPVARANAGSAAAPLVFVGHTHVPGAFLRDPQGRWSVRPVRAPGARVALPEGWLAFANPGSASRPRDGAEGGSYLIWDGAERTLEFVRFDGPA